MTNIIDDQHTHDGKMRAHPRVRIAYTLNNHQPVLCTLLNDQPYFYMDEDVPYEDEGIFDEEGYSELGAEVAALHKKIEAYDRLSLEFTQPADARFQSFLADASVISAASKAHTDKEAKAQEIADGLSDSRLAASLLSFARTHGVEIACSSHVMDAMYDRDAARILINPDLEKPDQLLLAVRELRRHWQHRQGVLVHPLMFHPDQAILINRAQLADLAAAMVRTGWELQLAGNKQVWSRIDNTSLADLGRSFAREAYVDFRTINSGAASAAVFETWFLSDRCRHQDKQLIQAMLADYQGYMFGSEQISRTISIDLISALGAMPFGKNYLAEYATMIMTDPVFTEVRDRSNANFLWFIKFERSFRETEQHLQSSGVIHTSADLAEGPSKDSGDRRNEQESDLARFERARNGHSQTADGLETGADAANVIFVQFGSARNGSAEAVH
jgi:hypothetical protein